MRSAGCTNRDDVDIFIGQKFVEIGICCATKLSRQLLAESAKYQSKRRVSRRRLSDGLGMKPRDHPHTDNSKTEDIGEPEC